MAIVLLRGCELFLAATQSITIQFVKFDLDSPLSCLPVSRGAWYEIKGIHQVEIKKCFCARLGHRNNIVFVGEDLQNIITIAFTPKRTIVALAWGPIFYYNPLR